MFQHTLLNTRVMLLVDRDSADRPFVIQSADAILPRPHPPNGDPAAKGTESLDFPMAYNAHSLDDETLVGREGLDEDYVASAQESQNPMGRRCITLRPSDAGTTALQKIA